MIDKLKKPVVMATLIAAALTVLGSVLGWFDIANEFASSLAESEFDERQNIALVIALIVVGVTLVAAATGKKLLAIVSVVVALFALLMVFNQLPSEEEKDLLEITVNPGYWLTLVGSIGMVLGSLAIMVKGTGNKE